MDVCFIKRGEREAFLGARIPRRSGAIVDEHGVVVGTHDGPLGPLPATGKEFTLPLCEMWHFDSSGTVVGGDLYYDQVSLLMQLGLMPQPSAA